MFFITADQNIQYQQNLKVSEIAVIFLVAVDNRFETLKPLMPQVEDALRTIKKVMSFISAHKVREDCRDQNGAI